MKYVKSLSSSIFPPFNVSLSVYFLSWSESVAHQLLLLQQQSSFFHHVM